MGNIPKPQHGQAWAVGKTLVFFKQTAFERVKFARLELFIKGTTLIQACWRRKVQMRKYKAVRLFTIHMQGLLQSKRSRLELAYRRQQYAARKIQALGKGHLARKKHKAQVKDIIRIQAWRKGIIDRRAAKLHRQFVSATKIQRQWRRRQEQGIYAALKSSIRLAQER